MTPQLHITQHKRFVPYGTYPNSAFGGTSFMLSPLAAIRNHVILFNIYYVFNNYVYLQ